MPTTRPVLQNPRVERVGALLQAHLRLGAEIARHESAVDPAGT
jgi:hypothetical protein